MVYKSVAVNINIKYIMNNIKHFETKIKIGTYLKKNRSKHTKAFQRDDTRQKRIEKYKFDTKSTSKTHSSSTQEYKLTQLTTETKQRQSEASQNRQNSK